LATTRTTAVCRRLFKNQFYFSYAPIESGISAHVVAAVLGHEDTRTTKEHYALEGAEEAAVRQKLFRLLEGGRR
jgi:hypothetical protein